MSNTWNCWVIAPQNRQLTASPLMLSAQNGHFFVSSPFVAPVSRSLKVPPPIFSENYRQKARLSQDVPTTRSVITPSVRFLMGRFGATGGHGFRAGLRERKAEPCRELGAVPCCPSVVAAAGGRRRRNRPQAPAKTRICSPESNPPNGRGSRRGFWRVAGEITSPIGPASSEAASRAAVARSHFWEVFGRRKSPTLNWLGRIAAALEADPEDLVARDSRTPPRRG